MLVRRVLKGSLPASASAPGQSSGLHLEQAQLAELAAALLLPQSAAIHAAPSSRTTRCLLVCFRSRTGASVRPWHDVHSDMVISAP